MNKIREFFSNHCLYFWHHWVCTTEYPSDIWHKEASYWHVERCLKCDEKRSVLGYCSTCRPVERFESSGTTDQYIQFSDGERDHIHIGGKCVTCHNDPKGDNDN